MASVSPSPSCSTIPIPLRRTSFAVAELRRLKQRRAIPPVSVGLGHFADVVRNDVDFLKNKIGIGLRWANEAFRVPEVTKSAEELFWLRHLEDHTSQNLKSQSWPQPSYSGLTGVDLFMADVKALETYAGYFYSLSKMWSRPLPEVYDSQAVADYFNCRPHVVAFRLLEVFSAFTIAAIRLRTSASVKGKSLEASEQIFGMVLKETMLHLGPTFIKVGQSLSTRPDIIGTEISKALSELQKTMASLFTPSPTTTSSSGDTIYVAAVPLKAAAGPPQLIMSMAYSLNISNLQHFMVLIKPSSPIRQEVLVFDFQPRNPESIEAAISLLSGNLIPGVVLQRRLKNVPRQRCWMVGPSKGNDAMEMAMEFNKSWETDLRVGFHDCRHYTNELVQHLTGEMQIVERLPRS